MANNTEKRTVQIIMDGAQPAKTIKELNNDIRAMTASLRNMDLSSDAWESHAQKLKDLKSQYKGIQAEVNQTANSFDYLKNQMKGVAIGVIGGNLITSATQSITSYFTGAVDGIAKLSDEMADIRKVTGLTGEQLEYVNSQLSKMDTRTSRSELRGLAFEAGKLGNESVEDVLGFVAAADKINIALGEDLGADAVKQIGKLVDIFKLKDEFGLEEGMLKIGSAINDTGAASTAAEGYMVDFLNRMAGVANIAKITAPEIIGVAGTLDSLAQSSEVSTTVLSKLLTKMGKDVPTFAKMAGVSVEEFREVMNQSGLDALLLVIEKMGKSSGGLEELSAQMGDIGLDGGRAVGVLGALAKNIGEVKRQTEIATDAFDKNTSILNEYNIKNETTAAKIEKLKKQINSLKESATVRNAVQAMIDGLQKLVITLKAAGVWYDKNKAIILTIIAAYITYNAVSLKNLAIQKTAIAFQKTQNLLVAIAVVGVKALILAEEVLTGKIKIKIALQRILNAVMLKNPYAIAIAGLVALGVAIVSVISKQQRLKKALQMEEVKIKIKVNTDELDELKSNYDQLKKTLSSSTGQALESNSQLVSANVLSAQLVYAKDIKELDDLRNKLAVANKKFDEDVKAASMNTRSSRMPSSDNITSLELEVKEREKLIEQKKNTLVQWNGLNSQYIAKIDEEKLAAQEAANQRKEIAKEELDRIKKLNEEYLKALNELQKLRAQALVQVIDDDFQRELAQLKLNNEEKLKELNLQVDEEIALARKLGKSKAEIAKLESARLDIKAGQLAEYNRQVEDASDKRDKDLANEEYQQELDNLAKRQAGRQILLNEDYKNNLISKEQYEDALEDLEVEGKEILLSILKDYGRDATQAQLDLSNAILKINKSKNDSLYAQDLANAQRRLAIAQKNVRSADNKGTGRKGANKEELDAQSGLLLLQIAKEVGITELTEEAKYKIKEKYATQFDELDEAFAEKEKNRKKDIAMFAMDFTGQVANEVFNFRSQKLQEELEQLQSAKDKEMEILDKQKEKGFLTDAEYQKRKEKAEADYDKKQRAIKRKQAVNDKIAALFGIAIQTALNVTSAFPNVPMMIAAGVLGALQAGFVAARKVPQYEKGTRLSDKILSGPSHRSKSGGIHMINPDTGELIALAEGGEVILSKETQRNNPEIVDALLNSSMNNRGASITSPAYYSSSTTPSINSAMMTKKVRDTTMMRNGGYVQAISGSTNTSNTNPTPNSNEVQLALQRNNDLMEKLYRDGVEAYFDYQKFEIQMDKQKQFKERSQSPN